MITMNNAIANSRRNSAAKSDKTRRRILSAAGNAFRERGIDGVGVRDIMKRAGLTRGGFYFHFTDKDSLFNEATRDAALTSVATYVSIAESAPEGQKLQAFIHFYLSEEHRDQPEGGCIMSVLSGEVGRANLKKRAAFTSAIGLILDRIAKYIPGENEVERGRKAGLLMASMAGVLMMSRVLSDSSRSDALLAGARQFYSKCFAVG
jgi:TetR/AcrR family transcriptional repressor of nem operon